MLVARETQLLHQDVAPAVRVGSTLQLVVNMKTFHRERKRHFKLVEVPAQVFKRLMKRQRYRESFAAQSRVRRVHHELRTRKQILRRRCTGVVAEIVSEGQRLNGVRDEVLECFVDDVDVRQGGVRVLARQREVLDVRTSLEQHAERVRFSGLGWLLIEKLQKIDEIGCGRKDRAAVIARAKIHLAEQLFERWICDHIARAIFNLLRRERCGPDQSALVIAVRRHPGAILARGDILAGG